MDSIIYDEYSTKAQICQHMRGGGNILSIYIYIYIYICYLNNVYKEIFIYSK